MGLGHFGDHPREIGAISFHRCGLAPCPVFRVVLSHSGRVAGGHFADFLVAVVALQNSVAQKVGLLIGKHGSVHGLVLINANRLISLQNFQFGPDGLVIAFLVTSQAHMLAVILGGQLGF